ncbi:MAG: HlyC/CorC family transporter [Elusimicrobia bacterium]|nr:HlyC/CorC family transporter [Elusimicrobiota bacterium]
MIYIILAVLLVFSAFFSSLETGLLALGEIRIRKREKKNRMYGKWLEDPAKIITGILVGNNMVNIIFSSVFTLLVLHHVEQYGIQRSWTEIISIVCSSFCILIAGEIIPKTVANTYPDVTVSVFYAPFMRFYAVFKGLADILNKVAFAMFRIKKIKKDKAVSRKELHIALKDITVNGHIPRDLAGMLDNVLLLANKTVGEVMKPRKRIHAVDLSQEYGRILDDIVCCHYSRIPAYYGDLDDFRGIIYMKDVVGALNRSQEIDFNSMLRQALITYPGRNCQHLFHEMRNRRIHCAVVMSNSRIAGFVTIEDIIEEVVGEIQDEYDYRYNHS